ncbi:MAG: DEAD/DEAH box helicase family protein [Candidatus Andersenbacteria bacterium]
MDSYFRELEKAMHEYEEVPEKFKEKVGDYAEDAWQQVFPEGHVNHSYTARKTGHGKYCPTFCLKLPTGGGKTLMATYAIDLFLQHVKKKKTGLVLWVVPSEQIFAQTIEALKDRSHPYREKLDDVTSGRVKIITKKDSFSPSDVQNGLVVLVLMLQSFGRDKLKKDDLKFFQDNGRFPDFFPLETDQPKQKALYEMFPNLDLSQSFDSLYGGAIKTSLGNVVKILEPLVVLDEGHKAKSELALSAINECNPSCVCELTATPIEDANVLFSVAGRELEEEAMIKLDLNLIEEEVQEWQRLVDFSVEHLDKLQAEAEKYKSQTGVYIRPINLIQVEKTGKDQRGADAIHADDVKEYLIDRGIPEEQIAIKTSSQNDIEGIDLLSSSSPIRFIITKQALQEGWDCSFAYVLTVLSSSKSSSALTQLVGRVLRQPYARKTGNKLLDESYVLCLRDTSKKLISVIQKGFEHDGMGDLFDRVKTNTKNTDLGERKKQDIRTDAFQKSLHDFILPSFVTKDSQGETRELDFSYDILPFVDYEKIDYSGLEKVHIDPKKQSLQTITAFSFTASTATDQEEFLEIKELQENPLRNTEFHKSFFVRNILDLIPNPWIGQRVVGRAIDVLKNRFSEDEIKENQILFLDALRRLLAGDNESIGEINRLAREVFLAKLEADEIRFVLRFNADAVLEKESYYDGQGRESYQKSLFEPIVKGSMNDFEAEFAHYLEDKKDRTYWWYRNKPKKGYKLIGWRRGKFFPDFIFTTSNENPDEFQKVYVVETKGVQLARTEDTAYKRQLIEIYNAFVDKIKQPWGQVEGLPKTPKKVQFELITQSEWQSEVNRMFS